MPSTTRFGRYSPDGYHAELAAAINETVGQLRKQLLIVVLLSAYAMSMSLTATDEAIFRDSQTQFQQIGVTVSLSSLYIALPPIIVVPQLLFTIHCLHVVRQIRAFELNLLEHAPIRSDRKKLRLILRDQFLIRSLRRSTGWLDFVCRGLFLVLGAIIPVTATALLQITFVRYQSEAITWWQYIFAGISTFAGLMLVLSRAAPKWSFRKWLDKLKRAVAESTPRIWPNTHLLRTASTIYVFANVIYFSLLAVILTFFSVVPSVDDDPRRGAYRQNRGLESALGRVTDAQLCSAIAATCRFLTIRGANLARHASSVSGQLALLANASLSRVERYQLMSNAQFDSRDLGQVEGLNVRGRTFRFATFENVLMHAINFENTVIEATRFVNVQAFGANFEGAVGQGVVVYGSILDNANFSRSTLPRLYVASSRLPSASFVQAHITGASFSDSILAGSTFVACECLLLTADRSNFAMTSWDSANLVGSMFIVNIYDIGGLSSSEVAGFSSTLFGSSFVRSDLRGAHISEWNTSSIDWRGARVTRRFWESRSRSLVGIGVPGAVSGYFWTEDFLRRTLPPTFEEIQRSIGSIEPIEISRAHALRHQVARNLSSGQFFGGEVRHVLYEERLRREAINVIELEMSGLPEWILTDAIEFAIEYPISRVERLVFRYNDSPADGAFRNVSRSFVVEMYSSLTDSVLAAACRDIWILRALIEGHHIRWYVPAIDSRIRGIIHDERCPSSRHLSDMQRAALGTDEAPNRRMRFLSLPDGMNE